jgi:hypothetical protein
MKLGVERARQNRGATFVFTSQRVWLAAGGAGGGRGPRWPVAGGGDGHIAHLVIKKQIPYFNGIS